VTTPTRKPGIHIQMHPLGCIFWLVVIVLFVAGLNWAMSR
jgi:hypothetical protein